MLWDRHLAYAMIFIATFFVSTIIWDTDHHPFNICSSKERTSDNCHRGFFHTISFGLIRSAIYFAYLFHMMCDYILN